VQRQYGEHGLAAQARQRPRRTVDDHVDRPEKPHLHFTAPVIGALSTTLSTARRGPADGSPTRPADLDERLSAALQCRISCRAYRFGEADIWTEENSMNIKSTLGRAAGVAAAVVGIAALSAPGVASASTVQPAAVNGPITCAIQTNNGHYVTAVGGGGRTTDVIHTDATRIGSWEKFTLIDSGDGSPNIHYGLRTTNGHYLTAVGGGGRITDVIHSDATNLLAWEKFSFVSLGFGVYAIQTIDGHYLTAVGAGGRTTDTIHSNATAVLGWEQFRVTCGV
jgi:hypothetical protein